MQFEDIEKLVLDYRDIETQINTLSIKGTKVSKDIQQKLNQQLFAIKYNLDKEVGMMEALELSKLEHTGTHHRGQDDSLNISNLLIHLLNS